MTDGAPGLGGGDRFSFESPAPSGDPANDLVHGMRWRAGAKPSKAAVIMLHGGFAPFFAAEKLIAPPFLKAGIDVLALALPLHMERARAGGARSVGVGGVSLGGLVTQQIAGHAEAWPEVMPRTWPSSARVQAASTRWS
ncbi:hypothetical protein [Nitratireductor alexandrii]|uniref:hypothetical protein n=1 Tax=Nitratireductor alexandrii TaxID=2448161 RepID=UPI000FD74201|nr:hypothetical protein [Nitratireductor alexandrii]